MERVLVAGVLLGLGGRVFTGPAASICFSCLVLQVLIYGPAHCCVGSFLPV